MLSIVRIIPVTIIAALILLGVKVGDVWSGLEQMVTAPSAPVQSADAGDAVVAGTSPADGEGAAGPAAADLSPAAADAARRFVLAAQAQADEGAGAPAAAGDDAPRPRRAVVAAAEAQTAQAQTEEGPADGGGGPAVPAAPTAQGGAVSGKVGESAPAEPGTARQSAPTEFSQAEIELLQNLSRRRDELDGRERQLEMRENLLAATEKRIEERIAELRRIESQIDSLLVKYDEQRQRQIDSLVKIYQNMKPKDAARIFERLDMNVLLEVAENMKSRSLAPILAEMDANRAQKITVELATRRQLPGTN